MFEQEKKSIYLTKPFQHLILITYIVQIIYKYFPPVTLVQVPS